MDPVRLAKQCSECRALRQDPTRECPECGAPPVLDVRHDLPCRRCGYSLRGLEIGGICPECGAPVRLTLLGNFLATSHPSHVTRLFRGAVLVEISVYIGTMLWCVASPIAMAVAVPGTFAWGQVIVSLLHLGIAAVGLSGWWLLSTPDPGLDPVVNGDRTRKALRTIVVITGLCAVASTAGGILGPGLTDPWLKALVTPTSQVLWLLASVVLFFVSVTHVRWLAARIPSASLEKIARTTRAILGWGLGIGVPLLGFSCYGGMLYPAIHLVGMATLGVIVLIGIAWLVWYCSLISGLRDRLESVRAGMPAIIAD